MCPPAWDLDLQLGALSVVLISEADSVTWAAHQLAVGAFQEKFDTPHSEEVRPRPPDHSVIELSNSSFLPTGTSP